MNLETERLMLRPWSLDDKEQTVNGICFTPMVYKGKND